MLGVRVAVAEPVRLQVIMSDRCSIDMPTLMQIKYRHAELLAQVRAAGQSLSRSMYSATRPKTKQKHLHINYRNYFFLIAWLHQQFLLK